MPTRLPTLSADLGRSAVLALLLVIPLLILEAMNQPINVNTLPGVFALFGFLWLLPTIALTCVMRLRRGWTLGGTRTRTALRAACLVGAVLLAAIWIDLVADQMPCFLGVPNCD